MKRNILIILVLGFVYLNSSQLKAQQALVVILESDFNKSLKTSFLNTTDELYQINVVSKTHKGFSCHVNFRMEDELISDLNYNLLNDVTFFDIKLSYQLGLINLSMMIDNLLGYNDTSFAIEPMLNQTVINEVYFSHKANFLVSTRITYNF